MVILQFKPCGLRIKRGWMHGCRSNPPLRTVDLLLVRLTILDSVGTGVLIEASRGLCSDPAWLIENSQEIRAAKECAEQKAREEYGKQKDQEIERLSARLERTADEKMKLATENHTLRRAIKIVES